MDLILKGFMIGIGKIIPGVSGSLIAISLGLYEKCIEAISNLFKHLRENVMFLGKLGIGILLSIMIGSGLISLLLNKFYFPTMFMFIGLISGTLPTIKKEININSKKDVLIGVISFLIMIIINMLNIRNNNIQNNLSNNILIIFILGIIDAVTMVIPGISGTAIFMLIGCYNFLLNIFSNPFNNLINLLTFGIGVIIGIVITSKLMNYLFNNLKNKTYLFIFGMSLSSIYLLFFEIITKCETILNLLIGIFLFVIGYKITKKLET